jgi:hypothetical protein
MNCQAYEPSLNDLVDGELDSESTAAIDAHVAGCAHCRSTVADLSALRDAARSLERYAPPPRLWSRIADGVDRRASASSGAGRAWQPLVAAAALVVAVSGLSWLGARLAQNPMPVDQIARAGTSFVGRGASFTELGTAIDEDLQMAEARYADAIATLESAMRGGAPRDDARDVAILRTSIADIDDAIGESRLALRDEPSNDLARSSLLEALDQKVALLHDTVTNRSLTP